VCLLDWKVKRFAFVRYVLAGSDRFEKYGRYANEKGATTVVSLD